MDISLSIYSSLSPISHLRQGHLLYQYAIFSGKATYDENGLLITQGVAAGTADKCGPYAQGNALRLSTGHRFLDVHPYIRALFLDGNPTLPGSEDYPVILCHPPVWQGDYTIKYLECRPANEGFVP